MELLNIKNTQSPKNIAIDMDKWLPIVNSWDANKENQQTYCQRLGVSYNTFSYVRSKLAKQNRAQSKLIPITVRQPEIKSIQLDHASLVLENPQGLKLYFSSSLSADQLIKIFKLSGWSDA